MEPERAHHMAMSLLTSGLAPKTPLPPGNEVEVFGVTFPSPVGLAAGFDKDGVALNHWKDLGFGFIEVGTVTQHAQPGNSKPRLFRLPEEKALINRMGFNNAGADALAKRLEKAAPGIPLGINIGKSKVTELEDAPEDYAYSYKLLKDWGDYFVVNVSSPNTPGLRELQDKDALTRILWRLKEIDSQKPLFVKISPDMTEGQLDDVVETSIDFGLTGIVATNTTIQRDMLPSDPNQTGGLSGAPVKSLSDQTLEYLANKADGNLTLIGVGGIMSAADAQHKLDLGASLVQLYSGFVYGGPGFAAEVTAGLRKTLPSA
jgi:dihydroorotate dehydrogenase